MIELRNISKTFTQDGRRGVVALREINLSVTAGDFLTILGSNGSGKSTLLNVIAGTVLPTTGAVYFDGVNVTRVPEWKRARDVARVYQRPEAGTAGELSVAENLALVESKFSRSAWRLAESPARLRSYSHRLSLVGMGMEERLQQPVQTLSGGQRQALAVIMAGLADAKVLLLDEHVGALDPVASDRVMGLTTDLIKETSITTLMVTHNVEQALRFGERTLMLHRGEIVLDVRGDAKRSLTVDSVVRLFHEASGSDTPKVFLNV